MEQPTPGSKFNEINGLQPDSKFGEQHFKKYPETIVLTFTMNGATVTSTVENVLESLRELAKSIEPQKIKTASIFHYEHDGKVFHRILKVLQMKMLVGNDMRRIMVAKVINNTLGLSGENLYK
jgi:hypothetical protein